MIHEMKMKGDAKSEELKMAEDEIAIFKHELSMTDKKNLELLQMEKKMDKGG